MASDRPDPVAVLAAAGLRITAPRVAVLRALDGRPHAAADTVARAVRAELGAVSTQAVYDVLNALTDAGLVRRIEPAGSPARYELRTGDNHHHVVCRVCGAIADVDCVLGSRPCLEPSETHGFVIDEAEIVFWGMCPSCRRSPSDAVEERPVRPARGAAPRSPEPATSLNPPKKPRTKE